MTQPPADILLRIEQLLSAGKQQEARLLLGEYIKLNPASARAWWLMSLTLTDINQQMDCLQRVLHLDPKNEPARERLAKLISQPPVSPSVSPFTTSDPAVTKETTGGASLAPAWAASPGAVPDTSPPQSAAEQTAYPLPPAPAEPAGKVPHPRKSKTNWGIVFILMAVFAICIIASIAEYLSLQRKAQEQTLGIQETIALAQTLTSLPLPTLIPTWTTSATITAFPTTTFTGTPTFTPTLQYTLTRTPRPSSLIGPVVGLYAPDFSLTDQATGQLVTLSQYDGQPVVLFFWATWCLPCKNEIGTIETISQTYKDAGLVVLAINASEDPVTVSSYQSAQQLTFPILLDPGSVVQSAYEINLETLPRHFFINSSGKITFIGRSEMTLDKIKVQLDAIMLRYPTSTP